MSDENCPACKTEYLVKVEICEKCQFPFLGTDMEKSIHIGQFIGKKGVIMDSSISLKRSQNILYLVALLTAVPLIMELISKAEFTFFGLLFNVGIVLTFLLCGIFIKKSPFAFVLIPLILLLLVYTINYLINPATLEQGIILKMVIIGSLGYSLFLQKSAMNFKKKYDNL